MRSRQRPGQGVSKNLNTCKRNSLTLALKSDPVVVGVPPLLRGEAVIAVPDLHLATRSRGSAGVKAEVGASETDLGGAAIQNPLLSTSAVAVVAAGQICILLPHNSFKLLTSEHRHRWRSWRP